MTPVRERRFRDRRRTLLRLAGRLCHVGAWSVELPEQMLMLSPEARAIMGISRRVTLTVEEAIRCYVPECRPAITADFERCVNGGIPFDLEAQLVTGTGPPRWVRSIGEAERDATGAIVRVQGAIQDITDRKMAADEALRLAARLTNTLDSITDAFLTMDLEWRFTFMNDEAERLLGTREELIGQVAWTVFPEAVGSNFQVEYARAMSENRTVTFEEYFAPLGIWVSIRAYPSEQGVAVYFRDITENKRIAEELRESITERQRSEVQLRQSQKMEAIGRLAGGVAHDFNNSLGVILGYTELLMRRADAAQQGKLEQILKATQHASGLTRQLLAFSRQQIVDPKVLDLNAVVSNLEEMLTRLIGEDIALEMVPGADLGQVKADAGQLGQVVINLCVNARDAMPDGGLLRIETSNTELDGSHGGDHEPVTAGRYVMLAVSDGGCGIGAETLTKIFEPFFTTKEEGKGTGLGLAMVYGAVRQAGGYVWVYSEPGRGTTFKIYLPRIDDTPTPAVPEAPLPARGWETILLVEDEGALRALAGEILEGHGYRVMAAANADEAIAIALGYPEDVHLLVTDVVMPGMNGRALAESLVARRPNLRVLYMSGYTHDVIAHRGVLEPGTLLIEKPFTAAALLGQVRTALGGPSDGPAVLLRAS